jgi:hypothetical protein
LDTPVHHAAVGGGAWLLLYRILLGWQKKFRNHNYLGMMTLGKSLLEVEINSEAK